MRIAVELVSLDRGRKVEPDRGKAVAGHNLLVPRSGPLNPARGGQRGLPERGRPLLITAARASRCGSAAAVVVARRGRTPLLPPSPCVGARLPTLAAACLRQ